MMSIPVAVAVFTRAGDTVTEGYLCSTEVPISLYRAGLSDCVIKFVRSFLVAAIQTREKERVVSQFVSSSGCKVKRLFPKREQMSFRDFKALATFKKPAIRSGVYAALVLDITPGSEAMGIFQVGGHTTGIDFSSPISFSLDNPFFLQTLFESAEKISLELGRDELHCVKQYLPPWSALAAIFASPERDNLLPKILSRIDLEASCRRASGSSYWVETISQAKALAQDEGRPSVDGFLTIGAHDCEDLLNRDNMYFIIPDSKKSFQDAPYAQAYIPWMMHPAYPGSGASEDTICAGIPIPGLRLAGPLTYEDCSEVFRTSICEFISQTGSETDLIRSFSEMVYLGDCLQNEYENHCRPGIIGALRWLLQMKLRTYGSRETSGWSARLALPSKYDRRKLEEDRLFFYELPYLHTDALMDAFRTQSTFLEQRFPGAFPAAPSVSDSITSKSYYVFSADTGKWTFLSGVFLEELLDRTCSEGVDALERLFVVGLEQSVWYIPFGAIRPSECFCKKGPDPLVPVFQDEEGTDIPLDVECGLTYLDSGTAVRELCAITDRQTLAPNILISSELSDEVSNQFFRKLNSSDTKALMGVYTVPKDWITFAVHIADSMATFGIIAAPKNPDESMESMAVRIQDEFEHSPEAAMFLI